MTAQITVKKEEITALFGDVFSDNLAKRKDAANKILGLSTNSLKEIIRSSPQKNEVLSAILLLPTIEKNTKNLIDIYSASVKTCKHLEGRELIAQALKEYRGCYG